MTFEQTEEFYDFLRGGPPPDGFRIKVRPRLGPNAAFAVLYVLQEKYRLIPDTFEKCCSCHELFDSDSSGGLVEKTGRRYCDTCLPETGNG